MKSEPESYGITHLKKDKKTPWNGVRNYLARNYMRAMAPGDLVLFYHSSCAVPGVYGIAKVASLPYPDPTQFDAKSHYFDAKSKKEKALWDLVDISYVSILKTPVPLSDIRKNTKLKGMKILEPRCRLSVTPVSAHEYAEILKLGS